MSSGRQRGNQSQGGGQSSARQNEYFVPRDGIDREVITADICRYLGNDALVRPGNYTDEHNRPIQGYYITAYRNLTTAMIADLKQDSARWDQERRRHREGTVRYQDSAIHHQRGGVGYTNAPPAGFSSRDTVMDTPSRFSTDTTGYPTTQAGMTGAYTAAYSGQPAYSYQPTQPSYSSPTTDLRYTAGHPSSAQMPLGYSATTVQPEPWTTAVGVDLRAQTYDTHMGDASMPPPPRNAAAAGAYRTGGMPAYPPTTQATGYSSYAQQTLVQPQDGGYGRAGTKNPAYSSPGPDPQYIDDPMVGTTRTMGVPAQQPMSSGTSSSRRERGDHDRHQESHRDRDRDRSDRDRDRDRRGEDKGSRKGGGYNRY